MLQILLQLLWICCVQHFCSNSSEMMLHPDTWWYILLQVDTSWYMSSNYLENVKRRKMSSNIRITKTCLHCGDNFIAKTTVTKYCSIDCGRKGYKERKRQELLQEAERPKIEVNPMPQKEFLSIKESCTFLGISRMSLYRCIKKGHISISKVGSRILIKSTTLKNL